MLAGVAAVTPGARVNVPVSSGTAARGAHLHVRANREGGLVRSRPQPARVPSQSQRGGGRRDDDEQDRSRLADRPPANLPAHDGGGQPPSALGCPVGEPGQQRQRTERDERHSGQRQRGSDGDHGIDPERPRSPDARPPNSCAVATPRAPRAPPAARSPPAQAIPASRACRPWRILAASGVTACSAGQAITAAHSASTMRADTHASGLTRLA